MWRCFTTLTPPLPPSTPAPSPPARLLPFLPPPPPPLLDSPAVSRKAPAGRGYNCCKWAAHLLPRVRQRPRPLQLRSSSSPTPCPSPSFPLIPLHHPPPPPLHGGPCTGVTRLLIPAATERAGWGLEAGTRHHVTPPPPLPPTPPFPPSSSTPFHPSGARRG